MKTKVSKWGNSLAVRIPAALAEEANLCDGTELDLTVSSGQLRLRRVGYVPTLDEMLDSVTPGQTHGEVDWGPPVGNEVW